jgi:Protein of unknown function (DUF2510)
VSDNIESAVIPAAWYPDPIDPTKVRWWDGTAWTEALAPNPEVSQPFTHPPTFDTAAPTVGKVDYNPFFSPEHEPMGAMAEVRAYKDSSRQSSEKLNAGTRPIWWFVFLVPLNTAFVLLIGAMYFNGIGLDIDNSPAFLNELRNFGIWIQIIDGVLILVISLALANADWKELTNRGFYNPPRPWIMLFPIVYMIIRTVRTGSSGALVLVMYFVIPLVTYIVLFLAAFAFIYAYYAPS